MAVTISAATFLHIPKCGGSWAVQAMAAAGLEPVETPPGRRHRIAATDGRFVFTFVRHPLTWYPSFWRFRRSMAERSGRPGEEELRAYARRTDEPIDDCLVDAAGRPQPFAAFVEDCVTRHPGFLSHKFGLYTSKAHFVGRQESLCADLLTALERAGAVYDPEVIRRTPRVNETDAKYVAEYPPRFAERLLAAEIEAVRTYYANVPWPPMRAISA